MDPIFRKHVDLPAIWLKVMCIQFPARLLSYDILRRCRQRQWWNTEEIQPRKFWSLCKMRGIADFGCKHAWAQKTWKPWKSILVTMRMLQGFLLSWLFWVMQYQVSVRKWKTYFQALLHLRRIATLFLKFIGNLCNFMHVLPVATASAKRSFSFIRHLKPLPLNDHECASRRLNHLMILSVRRNCTESLNVQ